MAIEHTKCPLCESVMVRAKSQFGSYWRCPRWGCEGTRDSQGLSKEERDNEKEDDDEPRGRRRYE